MGHNLMEKENGEFAYIGTQPAWHRLGTIVPEGTLTAQAALEVIGDYDVVKVPLFTQDGQQVDAMATIREDLPVGNPKRVLGIVGPGYRVVQNRDAFSFFDSVVGKDTAIYESVGALGNGETIFIVAKIPEQFWVVKGDYFDQYITLTNSHDGSKALRVYATPVRVVCQNTLNMSLKNVSASVCLRHTLNVEQKLRDAGEILGLATDSFRETQELFRHLATKPITHELFNQFVTDLFPAHGEEVNAATIAHREGVADMFEAPTNRMKGVYGTWYGATQAVTEYVDHQMNFRKDSAVQALFGRGARVKEEAIQLAVKGTK